MTIKRYFCSFWLLEWIKNCYCPSCLPVWMYSTCRDFWLQFTALGSDWISFYVFVPSCCCLSTLFLHWYLFFKPVNHTNNFFKPVNPINKHLSIRTCAHNTRRMDGSQSSGPVYVEKVTAGGPAEASGKISVGDELLAVDGREVGKVHLDSIYDMIRWVFYMTQCTSGIPIFQDLTTEPSRDRHSTSSPLYTFISLNPISCSTSSRLLLIFSC